jgi:hypothetical protein
LDDLIDININILLNKFDKNNKIDISELLNMSKEIYLNLESHEKVLKDINIKGYVNSTDLSNYKLINEVILYIIKDNGPREDSSTIKKEVVIGNKEFSYITARELFKWSYNLINLKMYMVSEIILKRLREYIEDKNKNKNNKDKNDNDNDNDKEKNLFNLLELELDLELELELDLELESLRNILSDYTELSRSMLSKLDPSIRRLLLKRGISITHNIYTGFDTEYVNIDSNYNKLLSVQLAVTSKTLLKLPIEREFEFEKLNVETNKLYKIQRLNEER